MGNPGSGGRRQKQPEDLLDGFNKCFNASTRAQCLFSLDFTYLDIGTPCQCFVHAFDKVPEQCALSVRHANSFPAAVYLPSGIVLIVPAPFNSSLPPVQFEMPLHRLLRPIHQIQFPCGNSLSKMLKPQKPARKKPKRGKKRPGRNGN